MCGLYASLRFAPERSRIDIVAHRGPDGSGWREFASPAGPVALGHRRLAIIDTSDAGLQPMGDASGRWLVFNGEIYNYLELREELSRGGHTFATGSDSEVLLAAYAEWGEGCLDRFLGMWAFVIFDEAKQRLFAARDRFGIKPLYVVAGARGLAFASEIKQLAGLPGTGGVNFARARDYLAAGLTDHTADTMFEGVVQLRAGECASIATDRPWAGEFAPQRWYALPPHGGLDLPESEAAERFRELLTQSVRLHLRSDVPVGSCLSGGLDSSAIVCLMSRVLGASGGGRVHTVSACYDDRSVDERPFMEAVVAATGATSHPIFPRADDLFQQAADITWHQDEPFGSTSILAQWAVFREARRAGVTVMLDGQGADEQLAGYHGAYPYYLAGLLREARFGAFARTVWERRSAHGASLGGQAARFLDPLLPASLQAAGRRWRDGWGDAWLDGEAVRALPPMPRSVDLASALSGLPPVTDIATLCLAMTFSANLQMLLHWEDRNAMAHGVEARVPFLDHRLVEFSLALGNRHKIVGSDTKRVLRRAVASILPEAVRARRDKIGFATPETAWFRGPLRGALTDGVETTLRRFPGLLDTPATRRLAAGMLDGRRPVGPALWRIVNLGIWGERFGLAV